MIGIKHGEKNHSKQKADEAMKGKYCPKYSEPSSLRRLQGGLGTRTPRAWPTQPGHSRRASAEDRETERGREGGNKVRGVAQAWICFRRSRGAIHELVSVGEKILYFSDTDTRRCTRGASSVSELDGLKGKPT